MSQSERETAWRNQQALALCHLPPHAALPSTLTATERKLITDMCEVGDESVLGVLAAHQTDITARVLLWRLLATARIIAETPTNAPGYSSQFGYLTNLPLLSDLPDSPFTTSLDSLLAQFAKCQQAVAPPPTDPPLTVLENERVQLLHEALGAPQPLQWIRQEKLLLAACETVAYLMKRFEPVQIWQEPPRNSVFLHREAPPLALQRLDLKSRGFVITILVDIKREEIPADLMPIGFEWQSTDWITDDSGYHYPVLYRVTEGDSRRKGWRQTLQLICFPTPVSTSLILHMENIILHVLRSDGTSREIAYSLPLGSVQWTFQASDS